MKSRLILPLILLTATFARGENEIGFIERFALAPDREKVLGELVPGTEDYYFFYALHYQNTKQAPKLAAILDQWRKRFPGSDRRKVIENREDVLAYDTDPKRTLKFLKEAFNLHFDHAQDRRDQKPDLPSELDQARISYEAFKQDALETSDLSRVGDSALVELVAKKVALRPGQRRALLARIKQPTVPNLVELIAEDLKTPENRPFGEFPIHQQLLPNQLDQLAKLVPRIVTENAYVYARIRKLAPSADEDAAFDATAREAWLDRLWPYVKELPASFNSLKASVLYRRLDHDRKLGKYNAERFLEYLKLPRQTPYAAPKWVERLRSSGTNWTDLNANFADAGLSFPPIQTDEPLVREYFLHLFASDQSKGWEFYSEWVRDTWLKPVFAEAMIVNGIGEPEKWASLISPAEFQHLKERVDLDFAAENPQFHAPGDDASLDVFIKNSPKLIVKIYELNALNYFLKNQQQLNTDLPLDGLVANIENTHAYDESPFRRVRRTFKFPELKGRRGAWVVEFIGGGRSSRALIRKGQWHVIQQTGPAGDALTVVDETYAPVKDAAIWLDGRKFTAAKDGAPIVVPFTAQPGRRPLIVADAAGTFATLTEFEHHAEEYRLDAQFHIEREQLLSERDAGLAIRTALRLNESELPLSLLEDAKLTIVTTTLDGISTVREVKDIKLDAARVLTQKLHIPDQLARLEVRLAAKIPVLSKGGQNVDVTAEDVWGTNGIDATEFTYTGHLSRFAGGSFFELLGKNGEPLPDRQVVFFFRHKSFQNEINVALRTNERGRVDLRALEGIQALRCQLPDNRNVAWNLDSEVRTTDDTVQAMANTPFEIPLRRPASRYDANLSLVEVRDGIVTADASKGIVIAPEASPLPFLSSPGLPPGDYKLFLPIEGRTVDIKVTKGTAIADWALGAVRDLQLTPSKPLEIAGVEAKDKDVTITLRNANPFTRVHLAATRYVSNDTSLFRLLGFQRFGGASEVPARLPNLYAAGRDIGDEYRYILERRYTQKFPGNMLSRPGLLLNPWEKRSTDQSALGQAAMQMAGSTRGARRSQSAPAPSVAPAMAMEAEAAPLTPNLDFLALTGSVIYNLTPDKDGVVRIDRKLLGDRHLLQVYAEDLRHAVWKQTTLPEVAAQLKDQRLTRNLDPAKPFAEKKQIDVIEKGKSLTLPDVLTSEIETYDTLASVFSLLQTLSGNETLPKFAWVLEWPKLSAADKCAKYSEFACHELNFFLSRKDPDFFATVVQPYLQNKKDKTFFDDYLLGADLKRYLEPWRFGQLNAAERALLTSRLPGEAAGIARHLKERWELLPPNPDEQDRLFETALRGRSMEESGRMQLELADFAPPQIPQNFGGAAPADPVAPATPAPKAMLAGRDESRFRESKDEAAGFADAAKNGKKLPAEDSRRLHFAERQSETALSAMGGGVGGTDGEKAYYGTLAGEAALEARTKAVAAAYYRRLGPTKEWAENNYYYLPIQEQGADLIAINAFWRDLAAHLASGSKQPFVSPHLLEAHHNFAEIMLALAVTDLPFEAGKHETKSEGGAFTINAGSPILAVHKQVKPATTAPQSELLVSQNFYRFGDRYRNEGNEKFDKYVTDEFLSGAVYGANIVVTNPTSAPQKLELLLQIPRGALPVSHSKATNSLRIRLEPFTTQSFEYFFYFPQSNAQNEDRFPHYPVNVARSEQIVGAAKPFAFHVVRQLSQVDKASWDYLSQYGTDAEVLAYLDQNNIERLDLERIAWRCRQSVDFFRTLVSRLEKRHRFEPTIYSYAVYHQEPTSLTEWLRHRKELPAMFGSWFDTRLVKLDPIERRQFEQLEYSPLVNQRIHRLGSEHRIANNVVLAQYRSLLNILSYKPALEPMDSMAVTTFLFLQDRAEEGLARLQTVNASALPTKLQYDFFRCYAAFYLEKPAEARGIANQYVGHPVERWRNLFADVLAQVAEIEGQDGTVKKDSKKPDRERETADLASAQPSFEFKVENRSIALNWKNVSDATINYYLIDPEFSFSSNPFVSEDAGRFSIIKPTKTASLALPKDKDTMNVPLPADFARANVVVEVVAAGQRKAQVYHANTLKLTVAENYGRLEVRDEASGKALTKAYVKVYARLRNGTVRFFKDGYTDLRGKFDYASLNSSEVPAPPRPMPVEGNTGNLDSAMLKPGELDQVERLSLLVLSEQNGAAVRETAPPRE